MTQPLEPEVAMDERPLGEIIKDLWMNTEVLIRQEMQLGLADAEDVRTIQEAMK